MYSSLSLSLIYNISLEGRQRHREFRRNCSLTFSSYHWLFALLLKCILGITTRTLEADSRSPSFPLLKIIKNKIQFRLLRSFPVSFLLHHLWTLARITSRAADD